MKDLPKYLPILSVALVFTGYCNLHFYYCSQFNIDIYQYISTGEIILSFLPILYYLFILTIIFGLLTILFITAPDGEKKQGKKKPRVFVIPFTKYKISTGKDYSFSVFNRFYTSRKNILQIKQKWFLRYKMWFHFQTILWVLWIILNIYVYRNDGMEDAFFLFVFGTAWIVLIFITIQRRFNIVVSSLFRQNYKQVYLGCILFILFIFIDYGVNKSKADDVKNRADSYAVSFNYEGAKFDTYSDTLLAYIGSTQQYIFIYNVKNKNNLLFEKNRVSNLIIGEKPPKTIIKSNLVKSDSLNVKK